MSAEMHHLVGGIGVAGGQRITQGVTRSVQVQPVAAQHPPLPAHFVPCAVDCILKPSPLSPQVERNGRRLGSRGTGHWRSDDPQHAEITLELRPRRGFGRTAHENVTRAGVHGT